MSKFKLVRLLEAIESHINIDESTLDSNVFTLFILKHLPRALQNYPSVLQGVVNRPDSFMKDISLEKIFEAEKSIKEWMDLHGKDITEAYGSKQ